MLYITIFFFQAEDGIRDSSVTGVQTCALPICPWPCTWINKSPLSVLHGHGLRWGLPGDRRIGSHVLTLRKRWRIAGCRRRCRINEAPALSHRGRHPATPLTLPFTAYAQPTEFRQLSALYV